MKDEHTFFKKIARIGRNTVIYKGTFISNQSLTLFEDFLLLKLSVKSNCFFLVKIDIDLSKTFPSVLTFYSANSMNFNTEFPNLMRLCLFNRAVGRSENPGVPVVIRWA